MQNCTFLHGFPFPVNQLVKIRRDVHTCFSRLPSSFSSPEVTQGRWLCVKMWNPRRLFLNSIAVSVRAIKSALYNTRSSYLCVSWCSAMHSKTCGPHVVKGQPTCVRGRVARLAILMWHSLAMKKHVWPFFKSCCIHQLCDYNGIVEMLGAHHCYNNTIVLQTCIALKCVVIISLLQSEIL